MSRGRIVNGTLTRPVCGIKGTPAIDRFAPEERGIVVRWFAEVALAHALEELRREDDDPPALEARQ
jgi:hypothetical protein